MAVKIAQRTVSKDGASLNHSVRNSGTVNSPMEKQGQNMSGQFVSYQLSTLQELSAPTKPWITGKPEEVFAGLGYTGDMYNVTIIVGYEDSTEPKTKCGVPVAKVVQASLYMSPV